MRNMKKLMKLTFIYLLHFQLLFISCNKKPTDNQNFFKLVDGISNSKDTFKIPRVLGKESTGMYEALKDWGTQLKINSVDTFRTKFEFRAWLNIPGLASQQRLFILRFHGNEFSTELIRFRLNWWENYNKNAFVMKSETEVGIPKSGWDIFCKKLFKSDFDLLFDLNIKDLQSGGSDGDTFCFEMISNNHYWLNAFDNPFENDDKREIFQLIKTIVQLIENEFNFYRMPVDDP